MSLSRLLVVDVVRELLLSLDDELVDEDVASLPGGKPGGGGCPPTRCDLSAPSVDRSAERMVLTALSSLAALSTVSLDDVVSVLETDVVAVLLDADASKADSTVLKALSSAAIESLELALVDVDMDVDVVELLLMKEASRLEAAELVDEELLASEGGGPPGGPPGGGP